MTPYEKGIYNEAQSLYLQAKAKKEEAYRIMEERLKAQEQKKLEADKVKAEADKALKRQAFSNKINNICMALGDAVKKEYLVIDGGQVSGANLWGVGHGKSEKLLFTVNQNSFPRMTADIYAVDGLGFRWEIKG
jgi:hypothetical protein